MMHRARWSRASLPRAIWFVLILVLSLAGEAAAVGKYCLVFWREVGWYEKGGTGGTHIINVHVWDQNGNGLGNKYVYTGGLSLGGTNTYGQIEIAIYMPNAYPLRIVDGSNLSDETPGFSSTRAPDWGHYSFECGFVYVPDSANAPTPDLTYEGRWNSSSNDAPCSNFEMSAPHTRSLAFCSTRPDLGYYCSDGWEPGGPVTSAGQTFKASGNRVVACKFSPRGGAARYVARIREGGPTGAYVGSPATSYSFSEMEYSKALVYWGLESVPVVPGNTYFLEITRLGGGDVQLNRVVNNNDFGYYYEGTIPNANKDLRGEVVCVTVVPSQSGAISGWVKDTYNNPIAGATVSTSTGGYSTTSDGNGNYTLLQVAVGTYDVTASKTGYLPRTNNGVQVANGQTSPCNFSLTPNTGAIAGYVRDVALQPVSGATVSTSTGGYSTTSLGDGSYTLSNVAAGTYDVTASKTGYFSHAVTGQTVVAGQTTPVSFTLRTGIELLTNGWFTNGCAGWAHSEYSTSIYWGCGNKAYPTNGAGAGGHSWNAFLSCGGYFCDRPFTGEQHQDGVTVWAGAPYEASAQVYYEPVKYPGVAGDQKERLVLSFSNGTTHTGAWHTHATSDGWDKITYSGTVPAGATKVSFRVELSHVDGQWSGTGAVDECSLRLAVETVSSVAELKTRPDGQCVRAAGGVVSAVFDGSFYIQDPSREAGVKVTGASASLGSIVTVTGVLATVNGERVVTQAAVE